jgi:hypothetical protein
VPSAILWFLTVAFLVFSPDVSAAAGRLPQVPECTELKLRTNVASPGQHVVLEGVPGVFRERGMEADFRVPGRAGIYPTVLFEPNGDRAKVLVILHPTEGLRGGQVELVISSGGVTCAGLPFTIRPAQAAPDALSKAARTFEAIVVREVERWGGPTDGSPVPVDAPDVVNLLDGMLRDIRGGNGRPSLQESIAAAGAGGEGLGIAGALYNEAGFTEALDALDAGLSKVPPLQRTQAPNRQPDWSPESLTPQDLEHLMLVQRAFEEGSTVLSAASQALAAAGLAAAATGVGAGVAGVLGTASAITSNTVIFLQLVAGILPASLEQLVLNGEVVSFEEDHPLPEGRWRADLYASSKGYKLDITTIFSLLPGIGDAAKIRAAFRGAAAPVLSMNFQSAQYSLGLINFLSGTLRGVQGAAGVLEISPKVTGPIRINAARDEELLQWQVTSRAFELDPSDPHIYRGLEAGRALLFVRTRPGRFAWRQNVESSLDLEVRPITVTLFAPDGRTDITTARPGDTVMIRAVVENALDPCLRWRAPNGGALTPSTDCARPGAQFSASDPGFYGLEAESTSRTGIRASATPRRYGGITVRVGGLQLIPKQLTCVEVGETIEFTVLKWGEPINYSMIFEAEGGTITPDGSFTARVPGEGGVRVSDPEQPALKDQVSFEIKRECPGWRMTLTGSVSGRWEGLCATFTSLDIMGTALSSFMPAKQALADPFKYELFDAEGNQVIAFLRAPNKLNPDGSSNTTQAMVSLIVLPFTSGIHPAPAGMFALNEPDRQAGLTIEHSWKAHPSGRGQLLSGTMSGVLYQDPQREKTPDGAPLRAEIRFRGMDQGLRGMESDVAGISALFSADPQQILRDPVRRVCTER